MSDLNAGRTAHQGEMDSSENPFTTMNRRNFLRLSGAGLAGTVLLGAVGGKILAQASSLLEAQFEVAARKHKVPVEFLLAMGYYNTLWEMPSPQASNYEHGDPEGRGAYGIMQLERTPFRDTLGKAASLTGLSGRELKNDRAANIKGGTALLSSIVGETRPKDRDGWQEAVAKYAGTDLYTSQVYKVLRGGASRTISIGESVELAPQDVEVPQIYTVQSGAADYPPAAWRPAASGNYTNSNREASTDINRVVIHVAQGSYAGTVNWFQTRKAKVSAHLVVARSGAVARCVHNADIAWHAGYWAYNVHSIGIEHAGYVGNPDSFTTSMYRASARLTAWCCKRYRIRIDRQHIIGHN